MCLSVFFVCLSVTPWRVKRRKLRSQKLYFQLRERLYCSAVQPFWHLGPLSQFSTSWRAAIKGGPWRARGARAYKEGLGAEPPAGSRGRAPGREVRGRSPLKLKHFLLPNVQWKPQIRPFFWNLETKTTIYVGRWRATWNPLGPRVGQHWSTWNALPNTLKCSSHCFTYFQTSSKTFLLFVLLAHRYS